jgi:RNA polymerase sigma factor (TIGR02999 family)
LNDELRQMAVGFMRNEKPGATLQPTMLVNEVYLRLIRKDGTLPRYESRRHFFGSVARAMNQVLIDQARHRNRIKRGGDRKRMPFEVSVGELVSTQNLDRDAIDTMSSVFNRLQEDYPRQAVVASMRWHRGLTIEQTAALLGETPQVISKEWKFAQAWLRCELSG